ncbi:VOC family protein [Clostridium sp.]
MHIIHLDHLVLTVKDIETSCKFYHEVLGLKIITVGQGKRAALCGQSKLNFYESGMEINPKANKPTPGSGDLCLVTSETLSQVVQHFGKMAISIEVGPVERKGAFGAMTSIYIRDPDANLVEISSYIPLL